MTTIHDADLKRAFISTLMNMRSDQLVTWNGKRQPAVDVLRAMMNEDAAGVNIPQELDPRRGTLTPTAEALAGLSNADRDALEAGAGIEGFTKPHSTVIRTKQDDGNHGSVSMHFRTNPETGAVERSHGPDHLGGGDNKPPAQPTVTRESGAPVRLTYTGSTERSNAHGE